MASKSSTTSQTKNIITIVFLFLIPVVGLILMWIWSGWKTWVKVVITALYLVLVFIVLPVLFIIFYAFVLRPYAINGHAMHPSFQDGEYVMSKPYNGSTPIQRGDAVIYTIGNNSRQVDVIKRVIGVPGDTLSISNSKVYINGKVLDESAYLPSDVFTNDGSFLSESEEITIPEGSYFVMGDNRPSSSDSRQNGLVNIQDIRALPQFCYWNCK